MKIIKNFTALCLLVILCSSCASTAQSNEGLPEPDERRISVEINDRFLFEFSEVIEADSTYWTGTATEFTFTPEKEKVVQGRFRSANDASWQDFGLFVDYLKLFEIPDQSEIPGKSLPGNYNVQYTIELRSADSVRSVVYRDPSDDLRKYWQSQNVYTFITFIENDLRWIPNPVESPEGERRY